MSDPKMQWDGGLGITYPLGYTRCLFEKTIYLVLEAEVQMLKQKCRAVCQLVGAGNRKLGPY